MDWATVFSAGSKIVGGLIGSKSAKKQREQEVRMYYENREYNEPKHVRYRAEEAGINPILLMGPGVGQSASPSIGRTPSHMGSAIADAGLLIADGMRSKSAEVKQIADLQEKNKELQKRLVDQTIRPRVGGIYEAGGVTIRSPQPKPLAEMDWDDPKLIGPRELVPVRDAVSGRWNGLDPGIAMTMGKKPGDAWIGEDNEGLLGEVVGNVASTGAAGTNLWETGGFEGPFYPLLTDPAKKTSSGVAPNLPDGESVDWSATSGPRAPVKPDGMSDIAWERLVRRNRAISAGR